VSTLALTSQQRPPRWAAALDRCGRSMPSAVSSSRGGAEGATGAAIVGWEPGCPQPGPPPFHCTRPPSTVCRLQGERAKGDVGGRCGRHRRGRGTRAGPSPRAGPGAGPARSAPAGRRRGRRVRRAHAHQLSPAAVRPVRRRPLGVRRRGRLRPPAASPRRPDRRRGVDQRAGKGLRRAPRKVRAHDHDLDGCPGVGPGREDAQEHWPPGGSQHPVRGRDAP